MTRLAVGISILIWALQFSCVLSYSISRSEGVKYESLVVSHSFPNEMFWKSSCSETQPILFTCPNNQSSCVTDSGIFHYKGKSVTVVGEIANLETCTSAFVVSILPVYGVSTAV